MTLPWKHDPGEEREEREGGGKSRRNAKANHES